RDPDADHRARRLAHGADGRALLRGLRAPVPDLPGRAAREARGGGDRDGRADRARHARHPDRRRGPPRDPGDDDPADARPRRVRSVLGRGDRRPGRDPPPDPDLLAARAHDYHHYTPGFMQRWVGWLGEVCTDRVGRWVVVGIFATLFVASGAATWAWST